MRITTNTKLIDRQSRIARYTTFIGLGVLLVSLISSFINISNIVVSYVSLFVGLIFAYVGSALANKWIKEPRADKALEKALKGFDSKYHLYNFVLPAAHVLLAPSGLLTFLVKPLDGLIICHGGKWQRPWRMSRLIGGMGQEPLGNPSLDLQKQIEAMRNLLTENLSRAALVPIEGYVVFTDPKAELQVEDSDVDVVRTEDLKEVIRKSKRGPAIAPQVLEELERILDTKSNAKTA